MYRMRVNFFATGGVSQAASGAFVLRKRCYFKKREERTIFFLITVLRSSVLKEPFVDSGLTSNAHVCALACHTHKHSRRVSTSVIGSLIFASARRQAPWDCEYRYSMTALRANKTDNPPSERRCLSPAVRFSSSIYLTPSRSSFVFVLSSSRDTYPDVVRYLVAAI